MVTLSACSLFEGIDKNMHLNLDIAHRENVRFWITLLVVVGVWVRRIFQWLVSMDMFFRGSFLSTYLCRVDHHLDICSNFHPMRPRRY